MKVVIINHSDTIGGASVVSRRLLDALVAEGVDARMIAGRLSPRGAADPRIAPAAGNTLRKTAFLAEEGWIFANNGFNRADLFKVDAGRFGLPLASHPWVRESDAVILNWVNQGLLSIDGIADIAAAGKRIIWTMHDMWPLTGICHHARECRAFTADAPCRQCPFVHGLAGRAAQLSARVARRKIQLYDSIPGLDFVAVSSWLADKARESAITRGRHISVIPNAFPVEKFHIAPLRSRQACGLPAQGVLIAMGAARLDDPVKGLPLAVDVLNALAAQMPRNDVHAVLFGNIRDPRILDRLNLPHTWLGQISDPTLIADIYAHSSAVLSTSLYETLPGTLIEGQAAGAWPVSFDRGGQADIISDPSLGSLVAFGDTDAVARQLARAIEGDTPDRRRHLSESVAAKFSARAVACRYIDLLRR